jgi:glutamate racemase
LYPFCFNIIFFQDIAETTFEIINPAIATAQEVKEYLAKSNLLNPSELSKKRIIVRGNSTNMKKTIQKYTDLQKINIEAFPEKIIENFINKAQRYCTPASTQI